MGKLIPFQPPPGVFKNSTPYQAKGRWSDCNLVRWKDGRLQPLGGWEKVIGSTITGVGRAMLTWRDFTGARWMVIGTNSNLYVFTSLSGTASDITPVIAEPNAFVSGNANGEIGVGFGTGNFGGVIPVTDGTVTSNATNSSAGDSGQISIDRETDRILTDKATSADVFTNDTTTTYPSVTFEGPMPFAKGDEIEVLGFSSGINGKTYPASHRVVSVTESAITLGPKNKEYSYSSVNTLTITTAGATYSAGTLSASSGGFTGTYTVDNAGGIDSVTITNGGSGYTSAPTVIISHSGDGNAVITADTPTLLTDETPTGTDEDGLVTIRRTRRYGNEDAGVSSLVLEASSWIFDLWGENLVGMSTSDGRIFMWDPTTSNATGTNATVIIGAPRNNSAILVSKQRHLFALGAGGNKRKIQWSHAESEITWGATATNQAGSFEIDSSGEILAGKTVGDRILVWTSTDLHAVDWVGMPFVYGRKKIGDACGAISNRSMVAVGDRAFWMSQGGFFQYQGSVQPLKCEVQDHIFKDINRVQDSKIYASINPEFFEVTWWYASSESDEILKYATLNYAEGWWSIGELCRTAFATGSPGVFDNPIGIADDGIVYEHEIAVSSGKRTTNQVATTNAEVSDFDRKLVTGTDATTDVGLCFAETVMEIGGGDNVANLTQLVTDTAGIGDNGLRFKFKTSYTPNGTESVSQNYDLAGDGYTDIREQGRQFTYRVESGWDQFWELGSIRAEMSAGGRR